MTFAEENLQTKARTRRTQIYLQIIVEGDSASLNLSRRSENCAQKDVRCFNSAWGSRAVGSAVTFSNDHGALVSFRVNFVCYEKIIQH